MRGRNGIDQPPVWSGIPSGGELWLSPEFKKFMETHPVDLQRGTTVARAIQEKKPVQIPDVLADKDFDYKEGAKIGGVRTVAAVPMLKGDDLIGVIAIYRREVRPFTDKQIELASTFADQAVIAIENVRLFDEVQARTRELSEALEQQTATSEVLQLISSSPGELEPVFQAMLRRSNRYLRGQIWHAVPLRLRWFPAGCASQFSNRVCRGTGTGCDFPAAA